MRRIGVALICLLTAAGSAAAREPLSIEITRPKIGDRVGAQPIVKGVVSDRKADVWVVVHELESADYWVQSVLGMERDGSWETQVYVGQTGPADSGKVFELMAIANAESWLGESAVLDKWPEADAKSEVIWVMRKTEKKRRRE